MPLGNSLALKKHRGDSKEKYFGI